jgi:hypothetical protein
MIATGGRCVAKAKARKKARRLPAFRSDEEERRFWDTHSLSDYVAQTRPVYVQVSKGLSKRAKVRRPSPS